jgi:hypothetical protein
MEPVDPRIVTSRGEPEKVTAPLSATSRPGGTEPARTADVRVVPGPQR